MPDNKSTDALLYELLNEALDSSDINLLAFSLSKSLFGDVQDLIKSKVLMEIISYATSHGQISKLLDYVKKNNPYQYDRNLPTIRRILQSDTAIVANGEIKMKLSISAQQRQDLSKALLSAFPVPAKLDLVVDLKLGENPATIYSRGAPYFVAIVELVTWAVSQGRLIDLVVAASGPPPGNPGNPDLREFTEQFFPQISQQVFAQDSPIAAAKVTGPEIEWHGPANELELQSWLRPAPDLLDVGFLQRALKQVMSVCRIEIPKIGSQGTGFLIAPTLLLTNYHVLKPNDSTDIEASAREADLYFGDFSQEATGRGQKFKLKRTKPLLGQSPIDKLDYVLLQVEDVIRSVEEIKPVAWDASAQLDRGQEINILQHPQGQTMKIAVSSDGITGVYPASGRVQYVTTAKEGSSGSPCFNDDWKVIALHHAERSRSFGSIREGILFSVIYPEIKQYL